MILALELKWTVMLLTERRNIREGTGICENSRSRCSIGGGCMNNRLGSYLSTELNKPWYIDCKKKGKGLNSGKYPGEKGTIKVIASDNVYKNTFMCETFKNV